ncbi:MAG: glycosyltransferase [Herbiconiux sp.]|uniref:bifunctional glycosyltransferase family 2/GtrA family protein n=1 Tax=Herbiconiux sp. TaxID=1871186 RepID=UPI0011FF5C5C|nr:bifunctional glycosyltransferase family 2/GtrA family protein [Herbiconiux sp.]TAJ48944.1 MAG: glycosyltransferase [Herbiconiux sp.]
MIVLIPSYEPDGRLVDVVRELRATAPETTVVVVDDGSGARYAAEFARARLAGAEVIGYPLNRGKGHALKHGLRHVQAHHPGEVVVCADSDGQHRTSDILRVAGRAGRDVIAIGGRRFTGTVPLRSRFGNATSRAIFRSATGIAVGDTQTGLRAYHPGMLDWLLGVKGDRFEYELNVLLGAQAAGYCIVELEIATVYLEHNASSHFRPVIDSIRVLRPFLRYVGSSLAAFVIDLVMLQVLFTVTGSLVLAVVGSRMLSGSVNFFVNRQLVFRERERRRMSRDAARYAILAVTLLAANLGLLELLTWAGVSLLASKLLTEAVLYLTGFAVQRHFVFRRRRRAVRRAITSEQGEARVCPAPDELAPRETLTAPL